MIVRFVAAAFVVLLAAAFGYIGGVLSYAHNHWPIYLVLDALEEVHPAPGGQVLTDSFGRLSAYPGKHSVVCPPQDERTAVILLIGQSNAANEAGQRAVSLYGDRIVSWFDGTCSRAASPLLGTTGTRGESWTMLANKLLAAGTFNKVVLVPAAIGGTRIGRWTPGGDLNAMLLQSLAALSGTYKVTHIVWVQGEDDYQAHTPPEVYRAQFVALVDSMRGVGIGAPVFVTRATLCGPDPGWTPDNPIALVQQDLPDPARGIAAGVDSDALIPETDRLDSCHFGGTGVEKFSDAMRDRLAEWERRKGDTKPQGQ